MVRREDVVLNVDGSVLMVDVLAGVVVVVVVVMGALVL